MQKASRVAALLPEGVVLDGDAYQARRRVWNGVVDHEPAVIVQPRSTGEVVDAVRTARQVGVPLSVRGGGHDWAGRAVRDGALVIDLGALRAVDIVGDVARAGGGALIDDLLTPADAQGLTAALAPVGSVGVAGLCLGGGYGPLTGALGMSADSVLAAEVVRADGSVVVADAELEPDLFWALRGGGGNFGVVTRMEIRLHPIPAVVSGPIVFAWKQARAVLAGLARLHEVFDDALDVTFAARQTEQGPTLVTNLTWSGQPGDGAQLDLIRALGTPVVDDVGPRRLVDVARAGSQMFPQGTRCRPVSRMVSAIDEAFVDAFIGSAEEMPTDCALGVHIVHGAATRVPVNATAYAYRDHHLFVQVLGLWGNGDGSVERAWVDATGRRLDEFALPGGYPNMLGPDDPRSRDAYGPNRDRLLAVKARHDPGGVFTAIALT